jgi:PPOX class probable F420-dependent enzyme
MTGQATQDTAALAAATDGPALPGELLAVLGQLPAAPGRAMLPEGLLALLRQKTICLVTTLMPDGWPQMTQVWATTDDKNILININRSSQKARNIERDPRVALAICQYDQPRRYYEIRGTVLSTTTAGADKLVEIMSKTNLGGSYPGFAGDREDRMVVIIVPVVITQPVDRRGRAG